MTMCVNGLFFDMKFFKLADGGRFLKPSADGKYIGDNRISGARGCSHLDGTKWRNILCHAAFFCWQRM